MPLTVTGMRVMMRQLAEVRAAPLDGIQVHPTTDLSLLRFDLDGPEGTPFAEGRFPVCLVFDEDYPAVPPKGFFRAKIFHPNVSDRGEICVNALKKDWNPQLGLQHVLLVIRCLLVEPNPESALNEEAGRLLLEDYASYERKARMLTSIHAKRPAGIPRFAYSDGCGSSTVQENVPKETCRNNAEKEEEGTCLRPYDEPARYGAKTMHTNGNTTAVQTTAAMASGGAGSSFGELSAELSHPLRSLESNNAYFASGKTKDEDVKVVVRGGGGVGCSTSPAVVELHATRAAQKKTTDKKKAALRRI